MLQKSYTRWIFVLPAMLVVSALFVYPFLSSIFYSFTNKNLIMPHYSFVGFDNYRAVLIDPQFWWAFFNSIKWTVLSLVGQVLVGFALAIALNRIRHLQWLYKILLIIPWAFPTIVIAFSWQWILNGVYGYLPNMITKLGLMDIAPSFLSDSSWAFVSLVFINIWFGAPLIMVNVLSALQTVPAEQYEAAKIDGANAWQVFRHITLPHIKVVIGLLVVLRTVWVFNNFDIIYLITGGGPANSTMTIPIYAYNMGWGTKMLGRSSAVTVLLFIFLLLICFIYFKVINRWEKEGE
ncbi:MULTISPECIES: carbohydrate ABC transporter permease [Testudinibacter]|uniref:Carbohydrate ABC transporter membrane protein 1 (CUT1 family) n=1 Tax=Testudinibacter aquarius TaxID=1524974 RepID=A0A4R3Y919_9PAST|nr:MULTISPECIES: sugar ABC transporter permease [Testudinibacter]TNH07275.1 sugar ABC transporter permease [Pasteurellaceae bacterium Phil11]KAE9528307.1 sugar ABC transporter permease [Testudinibacter aquarius]TCV88855.1 carbohydrate ABC transporter membrane protein 1 (CUT1 family) [Testudinibacter aquarius]TNG93423.1 sugar ABC transporter permease [Testudinibacter aquarius]TNH23773.1 sugar ABC transporter permease [Testudinibacter sp. TR-2022]